MTEADITYLIDVRRTTKAWSKRWSGQEIANFCSAKGIKYTNYISLGNISGKSHWISPKPQEEEQVLVKISKIANSDNVLLLCAEMDFRRCHRTEVAEKLQIMPNTSVKHLK